MPRAVRWRRGGKRLGGGRNNLPATCRLAKGRAGQAGGARKAGDHGVRRAPAKLSEMTGVHPGQILDASWTSEGWRKARRMPTVRGRETPRKNEGGRLWGSTSVNRRRGAGCGGVNRSYLLAKSVGCYSHPKCFSLPSEARRKKVPQSEAEIRPKRLKNESGL